MISLIIKFYISWDTKLGLNFTLILKIVHTSNFCLSFSYIYRLPKSQFSDCWKAKHIPLLGMLRCQINHVCDQESSSNVYLMSSMSVYGHLDSTHSWLSSTITINETSTKNISNKIFVWTRNKNISWLLLLSLCWLLQSESIKCPLDWDLLKRFKTAPSIESCIVV